MKEFIRVQGKDFFLLNVDLLGLDVAELWIGTQPDGPLDNDDERVLRERAKVASEQGKPGARISGISAVEIKSSTIFPGWYEVHTMAWAPGIYRFNLHSKAGVQAPNGGPVNPNVRDWQYSWPRVSEEMLMDLPNEQKRFMYLERNNAGHCFRIEITLEREILPAGDGMDWIHRWTEIKKRVEEHNRNKEDQAKNK